MRDIIRGRYCWPHINGVPQGMPPFYVPGCRTCEAKLAAGKVTKETPLPLTLVEFNKQCMANARRLKAEMEKLEKGIMRTKSIIRGKYCWPHIGGVSPTFSPFYNPGCVTCEAKLAAGVVSLQTPPTPSVAQWHKERPKGRMRLKAIAEAKLWRIANGAEPR